MACRAHAYQKVLFSLKIHRLYVMLKSIVKFSLWKKLEIIFCNFKYFFLLISCSLLTLLKTMATSTSADSVVAILAKQIERRKRTLEKFHRVILGLCPGCSDGSKTHWTSIVVKCTDILAKHDRVYAFDVRRLRMLEHRKWKVGKSHFRDFLAMSGCLYYSYWLVLSISIILPRYPIEKLKFLAKFDHEHRKRLTMSVIEKSMKIHPYKLCKNMLPKIDSVHVLN